MAGLTPGAELAHRLLRCQRATAVPAAGTDPGDVLLARYRRYLVQERGLAEQTTTRYLRVARRFLTACSPGGDLVADSVTAAAAFGFLTAECGGKSSDGPGA